MGDADTTTIRVHRETHTQLRAVADQRRTSMEGVICEALASLHWNDLREQARRESMLIRDDPAERRLAEQVMAEMDGLRAG